MITREANFTTKEERNTSDGGKTSKASSSSTSWSRLKDPRIVRVSRAFGGKDRHSKVCTVRGLRDRRVRLSVPTAIQLYDLQDRLGLNQPSKVVDWLLNAAKNEIDELPPLQIPPGSFGQNFPSIFGSHQEFRSPQPDKEGLKISSGIDWRDKAKEVAGEATNERHQNWAARSEDENSTNNFFTRQNHPSSFPGLLNNAMPYNSFVRWDPSNLSLSQSRSHELTHQQEDFHNFNLVPLPSTTSIPSGQQLLLYQPGMTQPYFPSPVEFDPKQMNFQMLSSNPQLPTSLPSHVGSATQTVRPFQFSMTANLLPSQGNDGREPDKDHEFHAG